MLEPHGRALLFDILKPPEGHVLDAAIATTYTLDLMALLTAPVAFSLFDVDDHRDLLTQDSLTLSKSLRRYADKITVFCQAGQIRVTESAVSPVRFLEQSIVQCRARISTASFHPKIWLSRYVAPAEPSHIPACLPDAKSHVRSLLGHRGDAGRTSAGTKESHRSQSSARGLCCGASGQSQRCERRRQRAGCADGGGGQTS